MSTQVEAMPAERMDTGLAGEVGVGVDDWDLDISFIEAGGSVDRLIYMTDDQCGTTCQSACPATCGR